MNIIVAILLAAFGQNPQSFTLMNCELIEVENDLKVIECTRIRRKTGQIVQYGNTCGAGTSNCIANPCDPPGQMPDK